MLVALLSVAFLATLAGAARGNRSATAPAIVFASTWAENFGAAELYAVDVATRRTQRLTTTASESEVTPATSPDGSRVAYSATQPRPDATTTDVVVADADGRHAKTIAQVPSYPFVKGIAWSPDGRSVAFVAGALYVAASDGGGAKQLAIASEIAVSGPSWAPDGSRLVFEGVEGVEVIARDGSGERLLASGGMSPAWAPDGAAIAFVGGSDPLNGGGIELADPDGASAPRQIVTGAVGAPDWSPDGQSLAFLRGSVFEGGRLSVVRRDGSDERVIAADGTRAVAWAPDGRSLAYVRQLAEPGHGDAATLSTSELHVVGADGTGDRVVGKVRLQKIATPVWSRGGRSVVYSAVVPANDPEIYVSSRAGQQPRALTHNLLDDIEPTWSPDHRWIAFVRGRWEVTWEQAPANPELYVMKSDGTNVRRITGGENPAWSPDGKSISFDDGTNVFVISARGGSPRLVAKDPEWRSLDPTWAPDGKRIAFVRAGRIMIASAHGGRARFVTKPPRWDSSPAWSPDGSSIVINRTNDICVLSVRSDKVRCLTNDHKSESPAWSRDGSAIAFARWTGHYVLELLPLNGSVHLLRSAPGDAFDPDP